MRRMRQTLRETSSHRTIGLLDAVDDLGTHMICGHRVNYSVAMIRRLLKGESKSKRLLRRIVEARPDLLTLSWVDPSVVALAKTIASSTTIQHERERQ